MGKTNANIKAKTKQAPPKGYRQAKTKTKTQTKTKLNKPNTTTDRGKTKIMNKGED